MEVEVGGWKGLATTVCAQPGLHYRSKSMKGGSGGGATGVTDLTFVCVCWIGGVDGGWGGVGEEKVVGVEVLQEERAAGVMSSTRSFLVSVEDLTEQSLAFQIFRHSGRISERLA